MQVHTRRSPVLTRLVILIMVIFGIHSAVREYERGDDLWMDEWEYGMITDAELNLEDIIDVGGWAAPDLEERVNCDNHVIEDHGSVFSRYLSGVHRAVIPIAQMKELVDEDDTTGNITYRCPDCSK